MGFLQQLQQQAQQVQNQRSSQVQTWGQNVDATESACDTVWRYLVDLCRHLNVIQPPARALSLDGKTPWPAMKLVDFRCDKRTKDLRGREVTQSLGLVWRAEPQLPSPERGRVSVNFPPDVQRMEARLQVAHIPHQRLEQRQPGSYKLQALVFEHEHAARASVWFQPDHEGALMQWRLTGVTGLVDVQTLTLRASEVTPSRLDDLAQAIVGQTSSWL